MKSDIGLEVLLSLDGTEYTEENGYWYKIEVSKVEPTKKRPHGIRYNLTLHDNYNQRILGFDNAHAVKAKKHGYYTGTIVSYDHVHRSIILRAGTILSFGAQRSVSLTRSKF